MTPADLAEGRRLLEEYQNTKPAVVILSGWPGWLWSRAAELLSAAEEQDKLLDSLAEHTKWRFEQIRFLARAASILLAAGFEGDGIDDGLKWLVTERDRLASGLTCFSCKVAYSPAISSAHCDLAHRENWGHEWVSERVHNLTKLLCKANEEDKRLRTATFLIAEVERLRLALKQIADADGSHASIARMALSEKAAHA